MFAARTGGEDVVVALVELIDIAHRVDMGELSLKDERGDDEVVVGMHVVAASRTVEDFVAEDAHRSESRPSTLILMEVEARFPSDEGVGMPADIGGILSVDEMRSWPRSRARKTNEFIIVLSLSILCSFAV